MIGHFLSYLRNKIAGMKNVKTPTELSMEELEMEALSFTEDIWIYPPRRVCDKKYLKQRDYLEWILIERRRRLNNSFVFSPETAEKFLNLDRQVMECLETIFDEGVKIFREQKQLKNNGSYFQKYNIEAKISPEILIPNKKSGEMEYPEKGIYYLLNEMDFECPLLRFKIRDGDLSSSPEKRNGIYFNKSENWLTSYHGGVDFSILGDIYLGYGMQELCQHTPYSLSDILKINRLRPVLTVTHQTEITVKIGHKMSE